jgi:hypothetical protein
VSKKKKMSLLRKNCFLLEIGQYGCKQNPEFYVVLTLEEIFQKSASEKVIPKNPYSLKTVFKNKTFFGGCLFGEFFLKYSFRPENGIHFWIFYTHSDLFREEKNSLSEVTFFYMKIRNPQYKG